MMRSWFTCLGLLAVMALSAADTEEVSKAYSLADLKGAVANASIPMIDVVGEHVFAAGDEITVPAGRTVTIFSTGNGVLTGGGVGSSRFFSVEGTLTLENLSLLGGVAADGGAVLVEASGSLTVVSCTMSYNRAVTKSIPSPQMPKSEILQDYGYGGAIFSKGALVVEGSKFAGNNGIGGAIAVGDPTLPEASASATVTATAFEANKSPSSQAGAIANFASTDVTRCMFSANYASTVGGALYSSNPKGGDAAKLVVTGSSFSANKVDAHETKIINTQDVYINSGSSVGDTDCAACEAARKSGGLPAPGFCSKLNGANMGDDGEPFYQCSIAPGEGVRHEQKGRSFASGPAVWW